jgi:hypothetical protein
MDTVEHDVRLDYAGFNEDHERLTCKSCPTHGGAEVTAVCQEWQKGAKWRERKKSFLAEHNCESIKILGHSGKPEGEMPTSVYLEAVE